MKFGYGFFCSNADNSLTTNHKFTLKNLNEKNLFSTFEKNLSDFQSLLILSKKLNCSIFRLGSNFIPFFSHPNFNKLWIVSLRKKLENFSPILKKFKIRITMHPSQFIVLNSDSKEIIKRSLKEIEYHFFVLDLLGTDENGVVVIHIGKGKENKDFYKKRFIEIVKKEKWLLRRLVIENDDLIFNVKDCFDIYENTGLPIVYDHFHSKLNPSNFNLRDLFLTWGKRIPKVHLSSASIKGRKGEHGDYVDKKDIEDFLRFFRNQDYYFDLIIEAKMKEKAILKFKNNLKKIIDK